MDASIVSEIQRALFSINNPIESNSVRKEAYLQLESFKENATDDLLIYAFETIIHQSVPCMLSTCAHNHEPAALSIPSSDSRQIALSHVMFAINLIEDAFLRRQQPTVGSRNSSSDQPSLISPAQNRIISTGNSTKIMQIVLWLCQQAEQSPCSQERALSQTPLSAATSNNQAKCATCSYLKLVAVKLGIIVGGLLEQVFLGIGASTHQDLLLFFKSGIHARFILLEGISSLMDVLSGTTYRRNVQPIIAMIFCNVSFILDLLFAGARGEGRALDMNLATQTCLDGWSRQTQISAYQGIAKLSTNTNSFLTLLQRDVLELAVYPLRTQITNRDGFGSLDGELNAACIAILANMSGVGSPSSEIGPSKFTSEMDDGYRLFIEKVVVLCLEYPGFMDSKHAAALAEVLVQLGCVHIPRCILAEQEALRVMSESGFRLLENYILIMLRLFLHDNPDLSLLSLDFWARWFAIVHADHLKRCPESKTSELEQNDEKLIQLRQRKRQLNIQIVELFVPAALRKLIFITLKDRMVKEQVAGYSFIVDFEDSTDPETDTEFDGTYWIQGARSRIQHSLQLAVSYCQREPDNLTSTINVSCSWAVEYALDRLFELICQVNKSVQEGLTMVDWDETRMITRLNELPDTQSTLWKFGELYGGLQATPCQSFARSALYVALRATSLFTCFVMQAFSVSQESKCSGGSEDSDQLFWKVRLSLYQKSLRCVEGLLSDSLVKPNEFTSASLDIVKHFASIFRYNHDLLGQVLGILVKLAAFEHGNLAMCPPAAVTQMLDCQISACSSLASLTKRIPAKNLVPFCMPLCETIGRIFETWSIQEPHITRAGISANAYGDRKLLLFESLGSMSNAISDPNNKQFFLSTVLQGTLNELRQLEYVYESASSFAIWIDTFDISPRGAAPLQTYEELMGATRLVSVMYIFVRVFANANLSTLAGGNGPYYDSFMLLVREVLARCTKVTACVQSLNLSLAPAALSDARKSKRSSVLSLTPKEVLQLLRIQTPSKMTWMTCVEYLRRLNLNVTFPKGLQGAQVFYRDLLDGVYSLWKIFLETNQLPDNVLISLFEATNQGIEYQPSLHLKFVAHKMFRPLFSFKSKGSRDFVLLCRDHESPLFRFLRAITKRIQSLVLSDLDEDSLSACSDAELRAITEEKATELLMEVFSLSFLDGCLQVHKGLSVGSRTNGLRSRMTEEDEDAMKPHPDPSKMPSSPQTGVSYSPSNLAFSENMMILLSTPETLEEVLWLNLVILQARTQSKAQTHAIMFFDHLACHICTSLSNGVNVAGPLFANQDPQASRLFDMITSFKSSNRQLSEMDADKAVVALCSISNYLATSVLKVCIRLYADSNRVLAGSGGGNHAQDSMQNPCIVSSTNMVSRDLADKLMTLITSIFCNCGQERISQTIMTWCEEVQSRPEALDRVASALKDLFGEVEKASSSLRQNRKRVKAFFESILM